MPIFDDRAAGVGVVEVCLGSVDLKVLFHHSADVVVADI